MQTPSDLPLALPSAVRPDLFLGGWEHAREPRVFDALGITHVVNAAGEHDNALAHRAVYHRAPLLERPSAPLEPLLAAAAHFVAAARAGGGHVLVHCQHGVSRSAAVCVAALMLAERLDVAAALAAVRGARPQVDPSPRLVAALRALEATLTGRAV